MRSGQPVPNIETDMTTAPGGPDHDGHEPSLTVQEAFMERWRDEVSTLGLPSEIDDWLSQSSSVPTDDRDRICNLIEIKSEEKVRAEIQSVLSRLLSEKAAETQKTAVVLRNTAAKLERNEFEELHTIAGANLATCRLSRGQNQTAFVKDELEGQVARSTFVKLEEGNSATVRASTLEEVGAALRLDSRILLTDTAFFRALHMLLTRFHTWSGKGYGKPRRSIREALDQALESKIQEELEDIVSEEGYDMSPRIMNCLLRLPPLDDVRFDTPATRFGASIGWRHGGSLPENEEDFLAQYRDVIQDEDYAVTQLPILGTRIAGAVVMGYWGYYLTRASMNKDVWAEEELFDVEVWEDYLKYLAPADPGWDPLTR